MTQEKKRLSFWQIWNMSFGFLGIQFGFALQGSSMSRIFQTLGAEKDDIPFLWIAAPLTGLLVQPIVGYLSDRTWHPRFGRRKPFFLFGAVLSTVALFFAPYSSALWMAAGSLWILDASINISMEPFRALVADKLPESQRSYGFMVQTLIIGVGTWIASNLPWLMTQLGAANEAPEGVIPDSVKYAFAIGAFVLFSSILYTILTTDEYPPEDKEAFEREKLQKRGFFSGAIELFGLIVHMPKVMFQLGLVQFFSWFAFFTMWSFATPAITEHIFGATDVDSALYQDAANRVGNYMGTYGLASMFFALFLSFVTAKVKINRKLLHLISLVAGGIGFILIYFISEPWMLHLTLPNKEIDYVLIHFNPKPWMLHICFALVGIAWASILSMPYAMLSGSVEPKKMGVYMGIFNMFIVIPQIVAALGGANFLYKTLFGEEVIHTMILAGSLLIVAGLCNLFITDRRATHD